MPPRSLSKTIELPSGEKAGAVSIDEVRVSWVCPRPPMSVTKMSEPVPTDIEKTARRPSGENRGAKVIPEVSSITVRLPPPACISITFGAPCS